VRFLRRQLGRIRTRLLVVNLVVLVVPVAGLEFARLYERQLLGALQRDMKNQAILTRELLERDLVAGVGLGDPGHERVVTAAATQTRTRIRVLGVDGAVVADSHRHGPPEGREPRPPSMWPHELDVSSEHGGAPWPAVEERQEVRAALAGSEGAYTRIRDRDPSVMLFLAEPVRHAGAVAGAVYVTRSTQPVLVELHRIRSGLTKMLAGALAFTVLLSAALAWTISRPLSRLVGAARRIAGGERDVPVPVAGSGEIRELGEAFAVMTQKLDARLRYISELSADIAHEFKSPLTSIRGAAELLVEGAADDPETRERFLRNIQLDADRLDRLVSRLLELSRIEASNEPFHDVALGEVLARVVERTHTPEQPVEVHGADHVHVRARAHDLERALLNLVENAVRFSPAGEPVEVAVSEPGDAVRVAVCDRGPGVPEEHRERVFERFFTTDAEKSGTGLGLAIVRTVAEAHGGRVELQARDGGGACFELVLPRAHTKTQASATKMKAAAVAKTSTGSAHKKK
jgi:two-component system, OmpR family, sensor histidine kinase ChvG